MIYIYLRASKEELEFDTNFDWERAVLEAVLEFNEGEEAEIIYGFDNNPKTLAEKDAKCYFIDEWVYDIYNHGAVEDLSVEIDLDEIKEELV